DGIAPGTDDSTIYTGSVSTARTDLFREGTPVGATQVTISAALPSGVNPPSVSGFPESGDPGDVVSEATIPGTDDPSAVIDGSGYARLYGLVQPWLHVHRDLIRTLPDNEWATQQWNQ